MSDKQNSGILIAGLALFSMFFGADDLIWPLILGGTAGDKNFFAILGLLITGISLPLLGLISMMLFKGDYRAFFERIGKKTSLMLIFIIQAIIGPVGAIPRSITLSYASLKPYLFEGIDLTIFSLLSCSLLLVFTIKPRRVIHFLGIILTPVLLVSLGAFLFFGFLSPPEPKEVNMTSLEAFSGGLKVGYNTLDIIAAFIFAPLVMTHFIAPAESDHKVVFKKMVKASLITAGLLSAVYIGLTYISSFYTPYVGEGHKPEEHLSVIANFLLGPTGAFIACIAVSLACLTSCIPIVSICGDYVREDLFRNRGGVFLPIVTILGISSMVANMGFMGIADMLAPVLQVLCPGLIVLSLFNIIHKLYERHMPRTPIFAAFVLSTIGYVF